MNRRDFLNFLGKSIAVGAAAPLLSQSKVIQYINSLNIKGIEPSNQDDVILADGLKYQVLISWKDKINKNERFGFNNDYIAFLYGKNINEGYLWVNHEYIHPLFFSAKSNEEKTIDDIKEEMRNVGGSFFRVYKKLNTWKIDLSNKFNQRVDALDEINFDNNITIEGSSTAIGTLANCSGGITPWRTILTCEENYDMFYGERNLSNREIYKTSYDVGWTKYFPFPPEHYGWVVEIDPFSGKKRKLVSLGRCAHECATVKLLNNKRVVVYTGDDMENGCLYKFISESEEDLKSGKLYVASMEKKKWIEICYDKHEVLRKTFQNQTEVLTYLRESAKLIGGTELDRPEDIEIDPLNNHVIIALTNNYSKQDMHGSLLKIIEKDNKHDSLDFEFETLKSGGVSTGFSCPDNLLFDKVGNLWFTSDISGSKMNKSPEYLPFKNNGLFVLIRNGMQAGEIIQVASAPIDAEFTGPCFSPDGKTLFLSVQHPGERSSSINNLTSHWPNKKGVPKSSVITIEGELIDKLTNKTSSF
ncbi:MAG: alkaline phosphatase [Flavobacteriales bacterium]|nr:alkaline phosphatase [Flavobacteriales bacterium]